MDPSRAAAGCDWRRKYPLPREAKVWALDANFYFG